uniref:ANK_REP_REGION domain-containing protein n=1 Tax=Romanomermis culicivorax TaxID=13658 RepID=A0A915IIN2_ROMCU
MVLNGQDFSSFTTEQLEKIIEQQVQKIQSNNILVEHKKQRLEIIRNESKIFMEKNREKLADDKKTLISKIQDEKVEIDKLESSINQIKNQLIEKRSILKDLDTKIDDLTTRQKSKFEKTVVDYRPKAAVEPFSHHHKTSGVLGEAYLSSKGFLTAYNAVEEVLRSEQISSILNNNNNNSRGRRFCLYGGSGQNDEAPPPDLIPRNEKNNNATLLSLDHDPDSITIRNDTLRAAKRRSSWADSQHYQGGYSKIDDEILVENRETEHIKALLAREQQKGRSTVNLSWIFGQLPAAAASTKNEEMREKEEKRETKNGKTTTTIIDVVLPEEKMEDLITKIDIEDKIDAPGVDETPESNFKGILKKSSPFEIHYADPPPIKRRIRFDPLALLLDAALEGDLPLVKWCSEQLGTVDESNGEGITALHNAICAGHYEIVRFLVEADADVNAQDSDGWTPLHCAASCNNLPAVQFLVERGACVFAQTLNDQQTPLDKCEEDSEGFDGCSEYLKNIQDKMGKSLNESRVFAAFPFEGEHEDEFQSLEIGQELIVLDRDRKIVEDDDDGKDDEKDGNESKNNENSTTPPVIDRSKIYFEDYWWVVRKADDENVSGLVPRNYLSLYPKLSIQRHWKTKIEIDRN